MFLRAITGLTEWELGQHLKIMHGVWVESSLTLTGLVECHDSDHEYPVGINPIPHVHGELPKVDTGEAFSWD